MKISHHFATENALLRALTVFLVLCSLFTLIVSGMSWGRYGYGPSISFYWAPFVLVPFWNWKSVLSQVDDGGFRYDVVWFGHRIRTIRFDAVTWVQNGKLMTLHGLRGGLDIRTLFCVEQGGPKQMMVQKLIQNPTFS